MVKFVSQEAPLAAVWKVDLEEDRTGGIYSSECTNLMRDCDVGQRREVAVPC